MRVAGGVLAGLIWVFAACAALAAEPAGTGADARAEAVWQAAGAAMQRGPAEVALLEQATLALPAGYGFVPREQSVAVMQLMGNHTDERFLGMVFPLGGENWFVTVDYEPSGHIEDDDAQHWDADGLLSSLREGTEAGNEERAKLGFPPMQVTRWIESPAYDPEDHELVWSVEARLKGGDDPDPTVNYNTYVLGREGYISMNLVTAVSAVERHKLAARELLAAVRFNDGRRYADFDPSSDKVAAYGLAALVGGLAAKKLGLLATAGLLLAKFGKVIALAIAGGGAVFGRWWKSRGGKQAP